MIQSKYNYLIVTLFLFVNCTNDSTEDLINNNNNITSVSYLQNIKPIIDNNCISCHKNPPINGATIPLTDFNEVKNAVLNKNLIERITKNPGESGFMPLGGNKLPQSTVNLVIQWQNQSFLP